MGQRTMMEIPVPSLALLCAIMLKMKFCAQDGPTHTRVVTWEITALPHMAIAQPCVHQIATGMLVSNGATMDTTKTVAGWVPTVQQKELNVHLPHMLNSEYQ